MSADPKDVVAVQDGSKLVDQPDYEKLCAEKQREIDKLQGMLERPFRQTLAKAPKLLKKPLFYIVLVGFGLLGFSVFSLNSFMEKIHDVADQPAISIAELTQFDDYEIVTTHLKYGENTVLQLRDGVGDYHYVPISEEVRKYIFYQYESWGNKHKRLDVSDLVCWLENSRKRRLEKLEDIRQKYTHPTSGAADGF